MSLFFFSYPPCQVAGILILLVAAGLLRLLFSGNGDSSLKIVVYGQPWFTSDLGTVTWCFWFGGFVWCFCRHCFIFFVLIFFVFGAFVDSQFPLLWFALLCFVAVFVAVFWLKFPLCWLISFRLIWSFCGLSISFVLICVDFLCICFSLAVFRLICFALLSFD